MANEKMKGMSDAELSNMAKMSGNKHSFIFF